MSKPQRDLAYGNLLQIADSLESGRLVPPITPFSLSRLLPADQCVNPLSCLCAAYRGR